LALLLAFTLGLAGCGQSTSSQGPQGSGTTGVQGSGSQGSGTQAPAAPLSGTIRIDGSSTVFPISAVASEMVAELHRDINVVVKQSGTSSGMGKFLLGEVDICDASRKIKDSELQQAQAQGIEVLEFTVALDGIAIVVHPKNDWVDTLTVEQLKSIWQPEATGETMLWNQVNPKWPEEAFKLYGPGTASGTFEYFTEVINGKKKASRSDYTASENDNTLVNGVAGDKGSLGYFGLAYYLENADKLKLIAVDGGQGPVQPSDATVKDGSYAPLSRPLFLYVNKQLLKRPEGKAFVEFYLQNASEMAVLAKYVEAPPAVQQANAEVLKTALDQ
jgi:phosphate transport system substrate-binding protein